MDCFPMLSNILYKKLVLDTLTGIKTKRLIKRITYRECHADVLKKHRIENKINKDNTIYEV